VTDPSGLRRPRVGYVPPTDVDRALRERLTRHLTVSEAGFENHRSRHYVKRPSGAAFSIFCACVAGSGWVRIDGATHPVEPGTAFFLPARVEHSYGSDADPWTVWWLGLVGTDVLDLAHAMGASPRQPVMRIPAIDRLVALIDDIVTGYESDPSPNTILEATGTAWKLLTQTAVERMRPASADPVSRAIRYLVEHPASDLRVADVAASVGISPSRLAARFHEATGAGVIGYQIGLRMARARQLLDGTDASIAEVAREVGYSDPFYFSRRFSRMHGMSPTAFRRRDRP
jgi:AraC family transcriptional regulator of arabinose operon